MGLDSAISGYTTDLAGNDRIQGSAVDMGAFESSPAPYLEIMKWVMPATAQPGDMVTYTIEFSNTGSYTATGVTLEDIVPISITTPSWSSTGAVITQNGSSGRPAAFDDFSWQVQDLAPNDAGVVVITGTVDNNLGATTFTNTATISSNETMANGSVMLTVTIQSQSYVRSDFDNDGMSDILWRDESNGNTQVWYMDAYTKESQLTFGIGIGRVYLSVEWDTVGTGDFNNDGYADLMHRTNSSNTQNGVNKMWLFDSANPMTPTVVSLPQVPSYDWQPLGFADFNDDGYTDVFWRNNANQNVMIWYMDGTSNPTVTPVLLPEGANWQPVAFDDFNGDGKADVFWRQGQNGNNKVWLGAVVPGTFTVEVVERVVSNDWRVVGSYDVNSDGNADVMWRHVMLGNTMLWTMDGSTKLARVNTPNVSSPDWKIVGMGDFDGDGVGEALWRHAVHGHNKMWFDVSTGNVREEVLDMRPNPQIFVVGLGGNDYDGSGVVAPH
jgi:uncharacterized repeat protein (TIGR01451 family)